MKNTNMTKSSVTAAVIALSLCFVLLLGATLAWFTDSVLNSGNKIEAGSFDVQLLMNTGEGYADISASTKPIFGADALLPAKTWLPDDMQVAYLAIKNNGTTDLEYSVSLNVENTKNDLYKVMKYAIVPDAQYGTAVTWTTGTEVFVGKQAAATNVSLPAGATHYFALAIHMDADASADYAEGVVDFDISILAVQASAPDQSYENANDFPFVSPSTTLPTEAATAPVKVSTGDVAVSVPEAVVDALPDTVTGLALAHTQPKVDTVNNTVTFDSVELVDQAGAIVDLSGNTAGKLTVTLPAGGIADGTLVVIYHDGEQVAEATVVDGQVTYEIEHLCAVSFFPATVVDTAADLKDALAAGGYIVLTQDIALTDTLMTNEDVVINLNGNAITAPANGNMFHSGSDNEPSIVINSSIAGAEINISGGDTAVLLGYGSTEIKNVTINVTGCDNYSPSPFNVYGDLTIGEGTVVNVDYLGSALISNNGAVNIVIDGAEINIGTFKRNGVMIDRNNATTFEMKNTTMRIDTYVLSPFGGEGLIKKLDGVTIENCTFDITDSNGASCTFVADADLGRYDLVQK